MKLAVVRNQFLNPWDASNYYGVVEQGIELLLCGTPEGPDWATISEVCPKAKLLYCGAPWDVMDAEPDVIDVPDPFYAFSQYYANRHPHTAVVGWETLPGKTMATKGAKECIWKAWKLTARSELAKATLMLEAGYTSCGKLRIIPGAVNTDIFTPGPGYDDRENAVLFVGRDAAEKGLADLICAMHGIKAELWVVGNSGNDWCRRLASQYDVSVKWIGKVPWCELPKWYQHARVFCLPSIPLVSNTDPYANWTEQFGQVLIEAMACGTPIVAADCGTIEEVLYEGAMTFAPRDWRLLQDHLAYLLGDERYWGIESDSAWNEAEVKYSQSVVGKQIAEWYFGGGE